MIQQITATLPKQAAPPAPLAESSPRVWGLTVRELHDAYWRTRGVQCVRRGRSSLLERSAELYLLLEPDQLVLFDLASLGERLLWRDAKVTRLRLVDEVEETYGERVILDDEGHVVRIERRYRPDFRGSSRIVLTTSRRVAQIWMNAPTRRAGWDRVRRAVPWPRVDHWKCAGITRLAGRPDQERELLDELVERWPTPAQVIDGLEQIEAGVWAAEHAPCAAASVMVGPLWLGYSSDHAERSCLVGPAWIGDEDADDAPYAAVTVRSISQVEMADSRTTPARSGMDPTYAVVKRAMDVMFSALALIVFSPLLIVISLLIMLEDGGPVFFSHARQGRGGRLFRCLKFRTMHHNAEQIARDLQEYNLCDGPQVRIENDPRVTRIGSILRRTSLDEVPQFFNVLLGQMSIVGPRPSPDGENQFCPAWRDARLSVRPGITGLWQLMRTRQPGEDFQEWIRFDLEYVQHAGWRLDLQIMFRTAFMLLGGRQEHASQ